MEASLNSIMRWHYLPIVQHWYLKRVTVATRSYSEMPTSAQSNYWRPFVAVAAVAIKIGCLQQRPIVI